MKKQNKIIAEIICMYIFLGFFVGLFISLGTAKETYTSYYPQYPQHLDPGSFNSDGCITVGSLFLWFIGLPFYIFREVFWIVLVGGFKLIEIVAAIKIGGC